MHSTAATPDQFIAQLPEEKKAVITTLRNLILKHLPEGFEEGMLYGMISYYIPLERYPNTYNKQPLTIISLAAQRNYFSLYLLCSYADSAIEKMIVEGFKRAGKKLDMGKSCLRFKSLDELSLPTIENVVSSVSVKEFIKLYEASREK